MKCLVLIDGHAILHRAYHAFPKNLKTRKGELVNAVYGFTKMLLRVIEDLEPDYIVVAFDLPKPTFRHKEFIGYQAQRPKMDTEMADQIERVHEVVKTLDIPIFEKEGFEADDVIGTLSRQAVKKKVETIIVTGDRDIMQLIGSRIKVYAPIKGFSNAELFGRQEVKDYLGVWPKQIVDYKALVGDSSDNYPGVPGVGPKTAVDLLTRFKTIDVVYNNLEKIRPTVAKKLIDGQESSALSKTLARIVTNAPVKLNLKTCRVHEYDEKKAIQLFKELEFKSLIRMLPGVEEESDQKDKNQMKLI
tara:strand:+ start:51 stop:959 length:909 start_codon:yes stop_codon:yes gene_type:complete